jgi:hypothetical protein
MNKHERWNRTALELSTPECGLRIPEKYYTSRTNVIDCHQQHNNEAIMPPSLNSGNDQGTDTDHHESWYGMGLEDSAPLVLLFAVLYAKKSVVLLSTLQ